MKMQARGLQFSLKETSTQVFSGEIFEFFQQFQRLLLNFTVFQWKNFDCPLRLERSVFLKNFEKNFFWYSYSFWKDLSREHLVVSKFLLEVAKFKENVLIWVITVIKVAWSFTHTFTSNSNTCSIILNMTEHRLLILINTSYMCGILLCRLMIITSREINC